MKRTRCIYCGKMKCIVSNEDIFVSDDGKVKAIREYYCPDCSMEFMK